MKHLFLALAVALMAFSASPAWAQKKDNSGKTPEQKTAVHAAHMAVILDLDDAHTARFTTLYTKYVAEVRDARKKYAKIRPKKKGEGKPAPLTDQQVKANIENQFALSQSILDIRRKYYAEYSKFLTPRQIEHIYDLEKKNGDRLHEMARKKTGKGKPAGGKGKPTGGKKPHPQGKR